MRYRGTLILTALVLLFAIYLYFIELPGRKAEKEEEEKAQKVLQFEPEEAVALSLTYPGRAEDPQVLLERGPDHKWQIVKPLTTQADQGEVDRLLFSLRGMNMSRELEDKPEDLKIYGLQEPEIKVSLRLRDREEHLLFGDDAPVGSAVYVKHAGQDQVFLVDLFYKNGLIKTPRDLRRKEVLEFEPVFVEALTLEYPGKVFTMARENEQWWIKKPEIHKADTQAVSDVLDYLRRLKADDFVDEGRSEVLEDLQKPRVRIEIKAEQGTFARLSVYQPRGQEKVYAVAEGEETIFLVDSEVIEDLDRDLFSLRDKHLLAFDRGQVGTVEIVRQDQQPLIILQGERGWSFEGEPLTQTQNEKMEDLIRDLSNLKAVEMIKETPTSLRPYGLHTPQYQVRLLDRKQNLLGHLLLGDQDGDLRYAATNSSKTIYKVHYGIVGSLPEQSDLKKQTADTSES